MTTVHKTTWTCDKCGFQADTYLPNGWAETIIRDVTTTGRPVQHLCPPCVAAVFPLARP